MHEPVDDPRDDTGVRWMLAWQAGEEPAFDRLVEHYAPQVHALVGRFAGPGAPVDDLVQEVFLRVIRARARYQPTARFSTFLYRIAFNLCANQRERHGQRGDVPLEAAPRDERARREWPDGKAPPPAAALEREDLVAAVRAAVAALPETQRMALILAKYEELSHAEIAAVLGSSEKAVKSLIHRARETLRELLAAWMKEVA